MTEAADGKKWQEILRTMLPPGASLPEPENLDYSFATEYTGPPILHEVPRVEPVDSTIPRATIADFLPRTGASATYSTLPVVEPIPLCPTAISNSRINTIAESDPKHDIDVQDDKRSCDVLGTSHMDFPPSGANSNRRISQGSKLDDASGSVSPSPRSVHSLPGSPQRPVLNETRKMIGVTFNTVDMSARKDFGSARSANNLHSSITYQQNTSDKERRRGICSRCGKGNRLSDRECCLVCDAKYCSNCVLRAMGSMPEGRKCVTCIGDPINESRRQTLGKCSRILSRLLSPLEVRQIMRAERECIANQLRPEQLIVNGRPLRPEEMGELLGCPCPPQKLKPGSYWYDKESGLWGKEGEKPDRVITSNLNLGGKLSALASNGNTKVFINGREITKIELKILKVMLGLTTLIRTTSAFSRF